MTDAPEVTSSSTPQAPAAAEQPATRPTASPHEEARAGVPDATGTERGGDDGAGDNADAGDGAGGDVGAPTGAPRARRSRGGRGRRRSGQAAANGAADAATGGDAESGVDAVGAAHAESPGDRAAAPPIGGTPNRDARRDGGPRRHADASRPPRRPAQGPAQGQARPQPQQPSRNKVHPVLQRLFELYPSMFGARFLPLKLGVYQDLLERHGDEFKAEDLKIALGLHARSTRYLDAVAAGHQRHDLDARPVEPVAPEHVHHAILEVFRRRQTRTPDDLSGALRDRIIAAIEASGIGRDAYAERVRARDVKGNAALDDALAELGRQGAKREALLRAFETTGKTEAEFADMYGMELREVTRTLQRARKDRADAQAFAEASAARAAADEAAPGDRVAGDDAAVEDAIDGDIGADGDGDADPEVEADAPSQADVATEAPLDASLPSKPQA